MKTPAQQSQNLKNFQSTGDASLKSERSYGEQIVNEIDGYINSTYFKERNIRFDVNEKMATGKLGFSEIQALFDMVQDKKKDYTKIIWKGIMIVNTIVSRLVGSWMQSKEKIIVKGVDKISIDKKEVARNTAEFYLDFKNELLAAQQQSGVTMIPQNQFVPDDKDHLDLWTKYELYLPEEYLYGKKINDIFDKEGFGFSGVNRRRHKWDSAVYGLIGEYVYTDKNGGIHKERIPPKNALYSASEYDDFRDCEWMGRVVSKKLSEIRELLDVSEKDFYSEIVSQATEYKRDDKVTGRWNDKWTTSSTRPYDGWNVDIVTFELRSYDTETTTMKVTSNGNLLIEKGNNSTLTGQVTKDTKNKWDIYEGWYVKKNKYLLKWEIKQNPVNPQDVSLSNNKGFSYSYYMYQNVGMRNLAIPEKIEEPVMQMLIARFKIQELVAGMRKAGVAIDITGTSDIDLGTGDGKLTQMQLKRVYDQTGNIYYSSFDTEGNRRDIPFKELANAGSVTQLQELVNVYNFHLQVVRDETGTNEQTEGQTAKPRTTNATVQTAIQYSENATDYMNDATLSLKQIVAEKIACLLHDSVEFESKEYADIMGTEDVKDRVYDVKIEIADSDEDISMLLAEVNQFVASDPTFIPYVDIIKLKLIAQDSLELASIYFHRMQTKAIQGKAAQAEQQAKMNADANTQSGIAVAQEQQKTDKMKADYELALAKERQRELVISGMFGIYQKGIPVPDTIKAVEGELVHNILLPIFAENMDMQAAASQAPLPQMNGGQDDGSQPQPTAPPTS